MLYSLYNQANYGVDLTFLYNFIINRFLCPHPIATVLILQGRKTKSTGEGETGSFTIKFFLQMKKS